MKPILIQYIQEDNSPGIRTRLSEITEPYPLHNHDFIEYEFVVEGCGRHFLNGIWETIRPGSLWILGENDCHAIDPQPTLVICCISCCLSRVPEYLRDFLLKQEYPMTGNLPTSDKLLLMRRYFDDLHAINPYDELGGKKKTALTLYLLCNLLEYTHPLTLPPKLDNTMNYVHTVIRYVQQHYAENIRLSDAAQEVGLTPSYLSTLFSQYANCGFNEYLTRFRITKAIELISGTNLPLLEIAGLSGFGCGSSMNRAFQKYMKAVPGSFRDPEKSKAEPGLRDRS